MGTLNIDSSPNSEGAGALFSSTQQRLLALLFGQSQRSFYARELISLTGSGSGAVQRELARLTRSGLLTVTPVGNQKHYQANAKSPVFHELRGIVIKSFGIADQMRVALLPLGSAIACAFIYGSVAKGNLHAASDIDVMIVSDTLTLAGIFTATQSLEPQLGRKINPTLYTRDEFLRRKKAKNPFLTKALAGAIIPLIGDLDAVY